MTTTYVPIYVTEGDEDCEFFLGYADTRGSTREEAEAINDGLFLERMLYNMKLVRIQEIENDYLPHLAARMGELNIGVISGPEFDEAQSENQ